MYEITPPPPPCVLGREGIFEVILLYCDQNDLAYVEFDTEHTLSSTCYL